MTREYPQLQLRIVQIQPEKREPQPNTPDFSWGYSWKLHEFPLMLDLDGVPELVITVSLGFPTSSEAWRDFSQSSSPPAHSSKKSSTKMVP